jgi:hypothetical protein
MWRGRFRGASPSKRVGRKEPCRRLARQVSDGEPSAARPHSCPRQSPTQLFITGPPTPTTTPTPPLRYIDAAFTGRRRLLDATATTFFVAREAHVRPPSLFVITTHHPLSPFNSPHHPPATFIRQPRSATTGPLLFQCPWTSALPNASVAPTVRLLRRPQQSLPLLRSTRTRRRLRFTCHLHGTRNLHHSSKEESHSRHHPAPLATKDT